MAKRKKPSIRFAVGSPMEARSSVWKLWAHGREIYLATRMMGRWLKASLHHPDDWRIAWTQESGVVSLRPGRRGRTEERWTRPAEFRPGWTQGPSVIVPWTNVLRPFSTSEIAAGKDPIVWLDRPKPGEKVAFTLLISAPGVTVVRPVLLEGDVALGHLRLTNDERVWVSARRARMTKVELDHVQFLVDDPTIHSNGGTVDSASIVGVVDMAGQPAFLDIALGHDHVDRRPASTALAP